MTSQADFSCFQPQPPGTPVSVTAMASEVRTSDRSPVYNENGSSSDALDHNLSAAFEESSHPAPGSSVTDGVTSTATTSPTSTEHLADSIKEEQKSAVTNDTNKANEVREPKDKSTTSTVLTDGDTGSEEGNKTVKNLPRVPRYATPTMASLRREAATLKALNENARDSSRLSRNWLRSPTRPRSPNLRLAARAKARDMARTSLPTMTISMSNDASNRARISDRDPSSTRQRLSLTVPKSPVFRSKGPSSRPYVSENEAPRPFVPTPLPAFLVRRDTLPHIKLNLKTRAAMDARSNPRPRQSAPALPTPRINLEPTIPKPFELASLTKHEHYVQSIEAREAALEDAARRRRSFVARQVNPAIFTGPTFIPSRSSVPLTKPVDLLPFASERSERTREFERRQRERIAQKERDDEMNRQLREEEEMLKVKLEMVKNQFKARPVPRSHYAPHQISTRSSERSGNTVATPSISSEVGKGTTLHSNIIQEETSSPLEYLENDPADVKEAESQGFPAVKGGVEDSSATWTVETGAELTPPSRKSSDARVETGTDVDTKDSLADENELSRAESTGSSTWLMEKVRKSFSPLLGHSQS